MNFSHHVIYRFYRFDGDSPASNCFPPQYSYCFWQPSLRSPWPAGSTNSSDKLRFLLRTILYCLGVFAGPDCEALCIYEESGRLLHYSAFTPRYWRFRFLGDNDLQIGNTWTDPSCRGRGLAQLALNEILHTRHRPGRRFWYVVEDSNGPSVRVVEKAGFVLAGTGTWLKPFGLKLLGSYVMDVAPQAAPDTNSVTIPVSHRIRLIFQRPARPTPGRRA